MAANILASCATEIAVRMVGDHLANKNNITAAGITYFALVSIFPLALVALSAAGYVYSSEAEQEELLDSIMSSLPLDEGNVRDNVAEIVYSIVDARGQLGFFGILSALYTGSALFTAVRVGLNKVFRGEKSRPFAIGKLVDIGMVFLFGIMLAASTAASFALAFVGRFAEELAGDDLAVLARLAMGAASILVALALSFGLFLLLYTRIPATNVSVRHAVPGALLAALLFEALKTGFAQYAANFGNYNATYGSLGFVVLLLAFIYFTSQVMLLGAEAAHSTAEVTTRWPLPAEESRARALRDKVAAAWATVQRRLGRPALSAEAVAPGAPSSPTVLAISTPEPLAVDTAGLLVLSNARPTPEATTGSRVAVLMSLAGAAAAAILLARNRLR